jgi:hypothetical protein
MWNNKNLLKSIHGLLTAGLYDFIKPRMDGLFPVDRNRGLALGSPEDILTDLKAINITNLVPTVVRWALFGPSLGNDWKLKLKKKNSLKICYDAIKT